MFTLFHRPRAGARASKVAGGPRHDKNTHGSQLEYRPLRAWKFVSPSWSLRSQLKTARRRLCKNREAAEVIVVLPAVRSEGRRVTIGFRISLFTERQQVARGGTPGEKRRKAPVVDFWRRCWGPAIGEKNRAFTQESRSSGKTLGSRYRGREVESAEL